MLPTRFLPQVQAFLLSGIMSFIMSGAVTLINLGSAPGFFGIWFRAWIVAFVIAFPTVLLVFPVARRLALKIASR